MPDIARLIDGDDPRLEVYRDGETGDDARSVVLWVQRSQRATGNLAANLAIDIANALDLPVIAAFCLVPGFPRATLRPYHFMAEGLDELPGAFAKRGIGWELRFGQPYQIIPDLARNLGAAVVITDMNPLRIGREWRERVADLVGVPLIAVDTDTVVPSALFPKEEWAARTIRPKIHKRLDEFLQPIPNPSAKRTSDHRAGPTALDMIDDLDIDRSVAPSPTFTGGSSHAKNHLKRFLGDVLPQYHDLRNRSDLDQTSHLSPYLHYGQIGPIEALIAARDAQVSTEAYDAFLNEILIQRELAINFALRNPAYDTYDGIPDWGKKTLAAHRDDPRPTTYTCAELDAGETHDSLWNACQRQLVGEGFMPNRLRMYWAKQVARWSETPEQAFTTLVEINDRYFLDGRDANSYAGIAWAVGGRHDRPFPPNRDIIGLVRPMGMGAIKRYFAADAYIDLVESRYGQPDAH